MTAHREELMVELVDEAGRAVGATTVAEAHTAPGSRHRAFSVLLVDPAGRLLLQRRAAAKTRFPLRWANACCGHPAPGQAVADAARQRLTEEIGVRDVALTEIGVYAYRAADPTTGLVEHEFDHVLLGRIDPGAPLRPDPDEVADLRWVPADQVAAAVVAEPSAYAPWLGGVVAVLVQPAGRGERAARWPPTG